MKEKRTKVKEVTNQVKKLGKDARNKLQLIAEKA